MSGGDKGDGRSGGITTMNSWKKKKNNSKDLVQFFGREKEK